MELWPLTTDDAVGIDQYVDVVNGARSEDAPWLHPLTPYRLAMDMRHGFDGEPGDYFVARDDAGDPVGCAAVFTSNYDNLDLAWTLLEVIPARRRQGLGTKLAESVWQICRDLGRPLVGVDGWDCPRTTTFAAGLGFEEKSREICRRQHLRQLPGDLVDSAYAEALGRASAYELVRIAGRAPAALLAEIADVSSAINDAPLDDLEVEDEVFTAERIRAYERAQIEGGTRLYRVLARHQETGELAGHTVVVVDSERPRLGEQHDTAVTRAHRGHRLGLLLKAEMLRWLAEAEPQLETLDTWNAESNEPMVGVNERLGYRAMGRELQFQRRV